MTLTFELDLQSAQLNQQAKYIGQKSFTSKVTVPDQHTWPIALPAPLQSDQ